MHMDIATAQTIYIYMFILFIPQTFSISSKEVVV